MLALLSEKKTKSAFSGLTIIKTIKKKKNAFWGLELRCEIWKNLVNIIEEDETKVPPQAPMKKRKVN